MSRTDCENDRILAQELTLSFGRQLALYRDLKGVVQKLLGQLVLSRGDLSCLMDSFEKKQQFLDQISSERAHTADKVAQWQKKKAEYANESWVEELETVLGETENAIREFLESEEHLKKYLESVMRKVQATPQVIGPKT